MKMDANKMIGMVVGVMVGVLVLSAALFPVIDSATTTERTFTNEGYYHMTSLDANEEYSLYWDHTDPYKVTINDTDVVAFDGIPNYAAVTLLGSDAFCLRFLNAPDNPRIQMYGGTGWGYGGSSGYDFEVTLSDGTLSLNNTAETSPFTASGDAPDKLYGIFTDAGEYVLKKANNPAYMLGDSSLIVLCGVTDSNIATPAIYADGTINDGLDYTLFRPSGQAETAVFSNESITANDVTGYIGLKSLEKIEFDITLTEGTVEPTYTYFIVPAKVTAELAVHASQDEIEILETIPILITVGLILGIVGAVFVRRLE